MAFLSIPGLGYCPDKKEQRCLEFDRNWRLHFVAGTHCDTPQGWATASMRMRVVSPDNCLTYFDSRRHGNPFHLEVKGNEVTHYVTLWRDEFVRGFPEGWLNVILDLGGNTEIRRMFSRRCGCAT